MRPQREASVMLRQETTHLTSYTILCKGKTEIRQSLGMSRLAKQVGTAVTLHTRIWEVLGSNLDRNIGYPG
jgi:hypothetical protein